MNQSTELQKAKLWFESRGIECYIHDNEELYVVINSSYDIMVSNSEVMYRAELFDEENNNEQN
jgi:hypothetical protein